MATIILESDVIGSFYQKGSFDYSRTKSTRKFVVYNNVSPRANMATFDDIITDLKTEDASSSNATPLGPTYGNEASAPVMHPIDTELPLQTVDVASLGADKFLVTAQYFAVPGQAGGAANIPNTMSLRAEYAAKRVYEDCSSLDSNGNCRSLLPPGFSGSAQSAVQYSLVTTVPQIKIRLPFYTSRNPIRTSGGVLNFLGGRNRNTTLGGINFGDKTVRFDGVTMDEFGGMVSDGANTYRFKGFYEFTARPDQFREHAYFPGRTVGTTVIPGALHAAYPSVETSHDGWSINNFEF